MLLGRAGVSLLFSTGSMTHCVLGLGFRIAGALFYLPRLIAHDRCTKDWTDGNCGNFKCRRPLIPKHRDDHRLLT
jgi:hypothetical protein